MQFSPQQPSLQHEASQFLAQSSVQHPSAQQVVAQQISSESSKTISYIWNAEEGINTIKIKLDNAEPSETTEENNEISQDIEIQEPREDFELKSISWNGNLYVGEESIITVTVSNNGGKDGYALITTYAEEELLYQGLERLVLFFDLFQTFFFLLRLLVDYHLLKTHT